MPCLGLATLLACAALAAGCGDDDAGAPAAGGSTGAGSSSAPAPDPDRVNDLPKLSTGRAARIATRIALVTARRSRIVEGAPGTPFTRTRFDVDSLLKGSLPGHFVLQVIGGQIGNERVESPVPAFVSDRRYILFLGRDGPSGPTIIPQAVLEVRRAGRADVVQPGPDGLPLLAAGSTRAARDSSAGPRLDDVLFSIRHHIQSP